ncbi:MAG TPA: HAMP domain-containing sensor histidine kinase [Trebonia sp.]
MVDPLRWWLGHGLGPLLVRWWRRRGLRARVTLTAALGLIVAFAAADLLLFNALRVSLTNSVDDYARSGATQVAALIEADRLPDPVPVAAGTITIQVLGPFGDITDASADADLMVPIVPLGQARALAASGGSVLINGSPLDMPSLLRVAVVPAGGGQLVIAAVPFSEASGSLNVVARALVIFTPVLFLAFTWAIWLVTGSTLRPIGALRRGAARVTATAVPSDLPVPEARDEVRSLALTLNDMLSRLAAAQQRQRALVSDTAHELRSPIASIRTQLEVALDFPDGQDWETTARDVHADVLRLARLAEDLLLLARLDEQAGLAGANGTGGVAGRPGEPARRGQPVDLDALSRSVACRYADAGVAVRVASAAPDAADRPEPTQAEPPAVTANRAEAATGPVTGAEPAPGAVTVTAAATAAEPEDDDAGDGTSAEVVYVTGEWRRLERLLVNLIDNAVRYARSSVTVEVRRNGSWAELSVTDDGPGIPPADRERVFDRFARLDNARSRDGDEAGGAGLGLAIVRATAQAYGGAASLEPASSANSLAGEMPGPGSGLRAVVRLPLRSPPA